MTLRLPNLQHTQAPHSHQIVWRESMMDGSSSSGSIARIVADSNQLHEFVQQFTFFLQFENETSVGMRHVMLRTASECTGPRAQQCLCALAFMLRCVSRLHVNERNNAYKKILITYADAMYNEDRQFYLSRMQEHAEQMAEASAAALKALTFYCDENKALAERYLTARMRGSASQTAEECTMDALSLSSMVVDDERTLAAQAFEIFDSAAALAHSTKQWVADTQLSKLIERVKKRREEEGASAENKTKRAKQAHG